MKGLIPFDRVHSLQICGRRTKTTTRQIGSNSGNNKMIQCLGIKFKPLRDVFDEMGWIDLWVVNCSMIHPEIHFLSVISGSRQKRREMRENYEVSLVKDLVGEMFYWQQLTFMSFNKWTKKLHHIHFWCIVPFSNQTFKNRALQWWWLLVLELFCGYIGG